MADLTARDLEVLDDLRVACDNYQRVEGHQWVRPLDCGGTNGSDHSYRLSKLARAGYAEQKRRGGFSRGSKIYRITDVGRITLGPVRLVAGSQLAVLDCTNHAARERGTP